MDSKTARENMVSCQLKPNKVNDKSLLARFAALPREAFVDPEMRETAYADTPLSIGAGREIFEPMVCARLLQELNLNKDDRVLVVAGGSGYTAAIVAPLVKEVVLVEEDRNFLDIARKGFMDAGIENVTLVAGKPEEGAKTNAPFHKIIIDAAAQEVPETLLKQLNANGQIAAVVEGEDGLLEAAILTTNGKTVMHYALFETKGTVLKNFKRQERFVF